MHFAFATIIGEHFHAPDSINPYPYDSLQPELAYYDFSDLVTSAMWAQFLYDSLFLGGTDVNGPGPEVLPRTFALYQNFPNPFNSQTKISFTLLRSGSVKLEVYNLLGQKVVTLADDFYAVGTHSLVWDGKNNTGEEVASGVYFYRLSLDESTLVRKMTLLK